MKPPLLIPCLVVSYCLTACDVRKSESTKVEISPKDVPADTVEIKEAAADGKIAEEALIETEEKSAEVSGAILGAAAGGVIGHQSGSALEGAAIGAAIGAAAGEIDFQPDEVEEE